MSIDIVLLDDIIAAMPSDRRIDRGVVITQDNFATVPGYLQGDVIELLVALYGEHSGFGFGYKEWGGWFPKAEDVSFSMTVPWDLEFALLAGFKVPGDGPAEWPLNNFLEEAGVILEDVDHLSLSSRTYLSAEHAANPEVVALAKFINSEVAALTKMVNVKEWWGRNMDIPLSEDMIRAIEQTEMLVHSRHYEGQASEWALRYTVNGSFDLSYKSEGGY
jgi:hypothetical protein